MIQAKVEQQISCVGTHVTLRQNGPADLRGQGRRGNLEGIRINDRRLQAGPEIRVIRIGAHDDPIRRGLDAGGQMHRPLTVLG